MKNFSIRMPHPLKEAVENTAKREGIARNEVIRTAVRAGMKTHFGVEVLETPSAPPAPNRQPSAK